MRTDPTAPGFFDPVTGGPPLLELISDADGSTFALGRRIGYRDARHAEPFVVPADEAALATFRTDLTSVPWFFAWLVPRVGEHLPAAVLHDGMVQTSLSGQSYAGPRVGREEADRVFRRAMASAGVPPVRRWLVWTAVTLATAWRVLRPRLRWQVTLVGTAAVIVTLGVLSTLDLLDVAVLVPWMGERPWWAELVGGAAFAVLVPLALSAAWGRLWRAGAIGGVALALLLHVTAAVVAVYGVYRLAEALLVRREEARAAP